MEAMGIVVSPEGKLVLYAALAVMGYLLKVLEKVKLLKPDVPGMSFRMYVSEDWERFGISVIGATIMFFGTLELGQLNFFVAAGCGYGGESVARWLTEMLDRVRPK